MEILIWIGAAITLLGLAGIIWSVLAVIRARKTAADDAEMRLKLQKVVPINIGALFLSVIGLMTVVVGVILG